jgi:hypothetical protein
MANDETEPVRTPSGAAGAQGTGPNTLTASQAESPRDMTTTASANLTGFSLGNNPTNPAEASNMTTSNTSNSSYPFLADSLIADSLVAESIFAESLVAESTIAESLASQSLFEESLATQSSTESDPPQRPRVRQTSRTTSSVPREESMNSSDREARRSRTVGWARPARRDRQKRFLGGSWASDILQD